MINSDSLLTLISVFANLITVVFIILGVWYTRRHFNLTRSSHYIERYNSKEMLATKASLLEFENAMHQKSHEERFVYCKALINSKQESDITLTQHIAQALNLFTEIGISYRLGYLDRRALTTFQSLIRSKKKYLQYFVFVTNESKNSNEKIWTNFMWLAHEIEKTEGLKPVATNVLQVIDPDTTK